jgi:hypothetical protein
MMNTVPMMAVMDFCDIENASSRDSCWEVMTFISSNFFYQSGDAVF